jgi:hypothetical protein
MLKLKGDICPKSRLEPTKTRKSHTISTPLNFIDSNIFPLFLFHNITGKNSEILGKSLIQQRLLPLCYPRHSLSSFQGLLCKYASSKCNYLFPNFPSKERKAQLKKGTEKFQSHEHREGREGGRWTKRTGREGRRAWSPPSRLRLVSTSPPR